MQLRSIFKHMQSTPQKHHITFGQKRNLKKKNASGGAIFSAWVTSLLVGFPLNHPIKPGHGRGPKHVAAPAKEVSPHRLRFMGEVNFCG